MSLQPTGRGKNFPSRHSVGCYSNVASLILVCKHDAAASWQVNERLAPLPASETAVESDTCVSSCTSRQAERRTWSTWCCPRPFGLLPAKTPLPKARAGPPNVGSRRRLRARMSTPTCHSRNLLNERAVVENQVLAYSPIENRVSDTDPLIEGWALDSKPPQGMQCLVTL